MLNNFIYAQTKALFEEHLLAGNILDEAVVFIEDTKEIWNHGTYFGGADVSKLESSVEGLSEAIAALQNGKQDTITDLETIRINANKGATAIQATSLASVAMSGNYEDLINKPEIPSAVTETTVSDWGFTKNTGTYVKPEGGIPSSDLEESIQTTLTNALQAPAVYYEDMGGDVKTVSEPLRVQYLLSDMLMAGVVWAGTHSFNIDNSISCNNNRVVYTTKKGGESFNYELAILDDIPTSTSALTNDSNYVTSTELTGMGYATEGYVDEKVAALVDGAPETLNTLDELAAALKDNADIVDVLNNSIGTKQNTIEDLDAIRSGAAAGATALQSVPAEYVTETELAGMGYLTANDLVFAEDGDIDGLFA